MICRETGYEDTEVCECVKCSHCEGEGIFVLWTIYDGERAIHLRNPVESVCETCNGSGSISEDCAIHGKSEIPVAVGIPSKPVRSETEVRRERRIA